MKKIEQLCQEISMTRAFVKEREPLIHCITNPISIHDCANVVLAAGGRPIMAEHPEEVAEITAQADALALNLGNITDARMKSIIIAGKEAMKRKIPVILDMVGIGCSTIRKTLTMEFLNQRVFEAPLVLKGNMSELKALAGECVKVSGVDVTSEDAISSENETPSVIIAQDIAIKYQAVILVSGKTDIVTDGYNTYLIDNGTEMMSHITGTGCMLNVLSATYLASGAPLLSAVAAAVTFGISGELAAKRSNEPGSFQLALLDALFSVYEEQIVQNIKIRNSKGSGSGETFNR